MDVELKGRTALITGSCGKGMGRSTALRLARDGANIVLNYGTHRAGAEVEANAKRIAEAIAKLGGRAIVQKADTTDEKQVMTMVEAACAEFGKVDILVNNAGGAWDARDYTEIDIEHFKQVLAAEIDGAFLTMKHVLPGMRERKWGRIIHISLTFALWMDSVEGMAPDYCLGKAARSWMTTAFGSQEFKHGITVNCIEPGVTPPLEFDEALKAASGDYSSFERRKQVNCHDVAEIIAFLCSDAGRFVSQSFIRLPMA